MLLYFNLAAHSTIKIVEFLMIKRAIQGLKLHMENELEENVVKSPRLREEGKLNWNDYLSALVLKTVLKLLAHQYSYNTV